MRRMRMIHIITCIILLYLFVPLSLPTYLMAQTELITNGGFESGSSGWILSTNFYADSRFSYPHTGTGYAYLSNPDGTPGNNLYGTMYQAVTIPPLTTTATLTFWYNITSQETGTTAFDFLYVTIRNLAGDILSTVEMYSNLNKDPAPGNPYYHQKSFDMTSYKGQTVRLDFLGSTDASLPTTFRIDDVSILAVMAQPILSVTPDNRDVPSTSGSTTFNVANNGTGTMDWTASVTSGSSWLSISSGGSGTNSGTITVAYTQNSEITQRIGTITVTAPGATGSPKSVTVTQAPPTPQPVLSVTPDNRNVPSTSGSTTFNVANNGTGTMNWTASVTGGSSWLSITSGGSGQNSGTITAAYTANGGTSERVGTITVTAPGATGSPKDVTVTQAGFSYPNLPIPYIRQNGDTPDDFEGCWSCGATCAVMIVAYYNRISPHLITVTKCTELPGYPRNYGWYVSSNYSVYNFTFDEEMRTPTEEECSDPYATPSGNWAYGAYGFIHNPSGFAQKYYARNYFWKHGLFSHVIYYPEESDVKNELDKGDPVWASTTLHTPAGHIVVIKGYTSSGYYVADPWDGMPPACIDRNNTFHTWSEMEVGSRWIVTTDPITQGDRVRVTASGNGIFVRSGPGKSFGTVGTTRNSGDVGTIIGDATYGPFCNSDNAALSDYHTWVKIQWDKDDLIGWSAIGDDHSSRLGGQLDADLYIEKIGTGTSVESQPEVILPSAFALSQNYPNPFNATTVISYSLQKNTNVKLVIYNLRGQKVKTLVDEQKPAGEYQVNWDGKNDSEEEVASGMYFYKLSAGDFSESKKMVLLR
jgi:hypothetical protein